MKLIVGTMNPKMKYLIKTSKFNDKVLVISKMCNVKAIKGSVDLIIPFGKIENNGLITNTLVHLEELLMSVKVNIIKYGNPNNRTEINRISNLYNVPSVFINLNNLGVCFL